MPVDRDEMAWHCSFEKSHESLTMVCNASVIGLKE
jgi:hypothetical protein